MLFVFMTIEREILFHMNCELERIEGSRVTGHGCREIVLFLMNHVFERIEGRRIAELLYGISIVE